MYCAGEFDKFYISAGCLHPVLLLMGISLVSAADFEETV